ncbi:MAG TPA: AbrB/MazE/SpoVT family DNA-binding domain-containing protein [Candidatus Hodarchaeales archaeon]|nr:AbrB/MazE/SpoVT family DNA-binding domain-containing protein [Candidatus Hodarchaeales archaeon]
MQSSLERIPTFPKDLLKILVKLLKTIVPFTYMPETTVTRGGQITLTKKIREHLGIHVGDALMINITGESAIISKRDPSVFDKHDFLPKEFDSILGKHRKRPAKTRLQRLGIVS